MKNILEFLVHPLVEENINNDDAVLIMGHSLKVKAESEYALFTVKTVITISSI